MEFDTNIVKRISGVEGNEACCDCFDIVEAKELWASINIGCVLCVRCAGIHRSLGTHISQVRSLTLDNWSEENVLKMESLGNNKVNSKFLVHVPKYIPTISQFPDSDVLRKRFITMKYVDVSFDKRKLDEDDRRNLCQKEGFLMKLSKNDLSKWQKRWCVLNDGALAYYRSVDAESPSGVVLLGKSAIISISKNNDISVRSATGQREYLFRSFTNDPEEALDWIISLKASICDAGRGSLARRALGTLLNELVDDDAPPLGSTELCKDAFRILKEGNSIREGFLAKRLFGGVSKFFWTKRYFVLIPAGIIYYFKAPLSPTKWKEPLAAMSILGTMIEKQEIRPFAFSIRSPEYQLLLCAESEEDREQWITALQTVIDNHTTPAN